MLSLRCLWVKRRTSMVSWRGTSATQLHVVKCWNLSYMKKPRENKSKNKSSEQKSKWIECGIVISWNVETETCMYFPNQWNLKSVIINVFQARVAFLGVILRKGQAVYSGGQEWTHFKEKFLFLVKSLGSFLLVFSFLLLASHKGNTKPVFPLQHTFHLCSEYLQPIWESLIFPGTCIVCVHWLILLESKHLSSDVVPRRPLETE